jgi:hypothetical protein
LRDYLSFDLPDRLEYPPVARDLIHVDPFVGLRDPEVNGHDHTLVRTSPRPQRRSCGQRALGIDDAVADFAEGPAQRIAEEYFVPMPVPGDASGSAASL